LGGLGYDIRVGRNISIAPSANYYWGKPGDLETLGEFLPEFKFDVFDVGVAITFH
jgi:hypothetical protein